MSKKSPFGLEVAGLEMVQRLMDEIPEKLKKSSEVITEEYALMMVTEAKRIVPVDTGHLRDNIFARQESQMKYLLLATPHYAAYVELGTCKMAAQPYMRPAVQKYLREYVAAIRNDNMSRIRKLIKRFQNVVTRIRGG